jgi:hypothetical protein
MATGLAATLHGPIDVCACCSRTVRIQASHLKLHEDEFPVTMTIESAVVERMHAKIGCHKPEVLMDSFGISLSTWRKLRSGQAIRQSVAERLLDRLQRQEII